jgi:glycosyltransferase involved in cell wall biosynthesis
MRDSEPPTPITIGVPVYNGEAFLAQALENLCQQSFGDFRVLIFDNASDDATGEIAARFVKDDRRFSYHRNEENIRAVPNFQAVLRAAESPYFLWRAADDVSDLNYLEVLHGLLEAQPDKDLAVGRVVSLFDGKPVREFRLPDLRRDHGLRDQYRLLFGAHPSWIYGLFRTAALRPVVDRITSHFADDARSWDNLSLLPFMLDFRIAATDRTAFHQLIRSRPIRFGEARAPLVERDFEQCLQHRRVFASIGRGFVDERYSPGMRRLAGRFMLWLYTNKNAYKFKHVVRRTLRKWVGLRP